MNGLNSQFTVETQQNFEELQMYILFYIIYIIFFYKKKEKIYWRKIKGKTRFI